MVMIKTYPPIHRIESISSETISPSILALIRYLQIHGPQQRYIFRSSNSKSLANECLEKILNHDREHYLERDKNGRPIFIEYEFFEQYSPLDLATALTLYMRKYLHGIFDIHVLIKIFNLLYKRRVREAAFLIKLALNTVSPDVHLFFQEIFKMMKCIDRKKEKNNISMIDLYNIISLSAVPERIVITVDTVHSTIVFFKILTNLL